MARDNIILQCTECKNRNYYTDKNKKTTTERLEFKKFCKKPACTARTARRSKVERSKRTIGV